MTGSLPPDDLAMVLRGFAVLALATWAARPLALRLVPGGQGWIAALLLAWILSGWLPWALAALHLVALAAGSLAGVAALMASRAFLPAPPPDARGALLLASGYALLFWLGLAQRLHWADLSGLEKFTDMAFLAAAMRADWMPPQDAWLSGATVNYYYVGQAMVGAWGHIAGAPPAAAYQIGMASLFALTGMAVFRLVSGLAQTFGARTAPVLGGLAVALTLYGGNLHSALYTIARDLMPATKAEFYYPDSTRFIGYDPPTLDKGYTEFPAYAFFVGDLHAHVVATPVFLFGLILLLAILSRGLNLDKPGHTAGYPGPDPWQVVALGWTLGLCLSINTWDLATLGLLALIVLVLLVLQPGSPLRARADALGAAAVLALAVAAVTAAPFLGAFTPFASGIERAPATTPVWQLLVVYGHALPVLALFALAFARRLPTAEGAAIGLLFTGALILIALPETVIVRDIYGIDFARANTMFKLSFRAQTLLIVAGCAAIGLIMSRRGWWNGAGIAAAVILALPLAYAAEVFTPPSVIRTLDGHGFLGEERALVEAASRQTLAPGEALIEATGDPFGPTARVSAMTGLPAVIGWANHQWLWRNDRGWCSSGPIRSGPSTPQPIRRCAAASSAATASVWSFWAGSRPRSIRTFRPQRLPNWGRQCTRGRAEGSSASPLVPVHSARSPPSCEIIALARGRRVEFNRNGRRPAEVHG